MTIHSAFNGTVQFDCTVTNLKTMIIREGLERAVPESALFDSDSVSGKVFDNLVEFLGKTRSIKFADIGLNPDAEALQDFWIFVSSVLDYRSIWNEFLMLSPEVNNEWMDAINAVVDPRLLAPLEVQPGSPSDEELEATGTDGAKKKKVAKPI